MKFTRLSFQKRSRIVQCFVEDVDATLASRLVMVNRKTINAWYRELRRRLLPYASTVPSESTARYRAYETKRLQKFYGLRRRDMPYHIAESKVRFALKARFRALVIEAADDLL